MAQTPPELGVVMRGPQIVGVPGDRRKLLDSGRPFSTRKAKGNWPYPCVIRPMVHVTWRGLRHSRAGVSPKGMITSRSQRHAPARVTLPFRDQSHFFQDAASPVRSLLARTAPRSPSILCCGIARADRDDASHAARRGILCRRSIRASFTVKTSPLFRCPSRQWQAAERPEIKRGPA